MPSSYIWGKLREAYQGLPIPSDAGFQAIDLITAWLERQGVTGKGGSVIAVAHASNNHIYFAFSPALQTECKDKNLARNIADSHREIQTYCTTTDQTIAKFYEDRNPGCAEKKVFTRVRLAGAIIDNLTVGAYPDGSRPRLSAYVGFGDAERGGYVAPCATCIAAYTSFGFKSSASASASSD